MTAETVTRYIRMAVWVSVLFMLASLIALVYRVYTLLGDLSVSQRQAAVWSADEAAKTDKALFGSDGIMPRLSATLKRADLLVTTADGLVNQSRDIARDEHKAFGPQTQQMHDLLVSAGSAADALTTGLSSVNGEILPKLNAAVDNVAKLAGGLTAVSADAGRVLEHTDALVSDPSVKQSLTNIANTSAETDRLMFGLNSSLYGNGGTFSQLNGTLSGLNRGVGYVADRFKPTTKNFWLGIPSDIGLLMRALISSGVF